jgi:hypothetical protein
MICNQVFVNSFMYELSAVSIMTCALLHIFPSNHCCTAVSYHSRAAYYDHLFMMICNQVFVNSFMYELSAVYIMSLCFASHVPVGRPGLAPNTTTCERLW